MECTHACEAIRYRWTVPGDAIYQKFKPLKAEVWAYILILAAIPVSMTFAHGLGRSNIADQMIWNRTSLWMENLLNTGNLHLGGAFAFLYAALFTIAFAVGECGSLHAFLSKITKRSFIRWVMPLLPFFS
jgi:hypothetical protein